MSFLRCAWVRSRSVAPLLVGAVVCACGGGPARPATPVPAVEPPPVPAGRVPPAGPYEPAFDALHYGIQVVLPDSGTVLRGTTTVVVAVRERRDSLRLDLSGLAVEAVRVGVGSGPVRNSGFRQADGRLFVPLPPSARSGDTLHVEVGYGGHPDDGLIMGATIHGARAVFADNWPDRARFWFPAIDHPSDKATVDFEVTAPVGWEVVANGTRTGANEAGADPPADGVWRWSVSVPIPTYTMVIGATRFAVRVVAACAQGGVTVLRPDGCVPVSTWVYPQDSAAAIAPFRRAGDMVAYFSDLVAPFPYAKLAHVQSATRFGGMENVGAIFYDQRAFDGRDLEATVAHETAHQWFGDAVTEESWHHLWLSEGFATYFAALYFEHADGEERFRRMVKTSGEGYLDSPDTSLAMVDTTAVPDDNLFSLLNRNSYNKGGQVLHMLRGLLGDTAFFEGIRRYYRAHVHGNAVTADLEAALEQASGKDLGWFFRQWVYAPGYPRFLARWHWDDATGQAVVQLRQVQADAWPTFRVPMDIVFETARGPMRRRIEVRSRDETLRLPLPAEPTALQVDPDGWVLKRVEVERY